MSGHGIETKLAILRDNLVRLAAIPQQSLDEFRADFRNIDSALHHPAQPVADDPGLNERSASLLQRWRNADNAARSAAVSGRIRPSGRSPSSIGPIASRCSRVMWKSPMPTCPTLAIFSITTRASRWTKESPVL